MESLFVVMLSVRLKHNPTEKKYGHVTKVKILLLVL